MIQRVNVVSVRVKKRGGRVLLQLQTKCNDDEDKDKDNVEYEDKYMSTTILCAYRWWTWLGARETRRRQTATLPFHLFSFPIPLSTLTKFLFPFPFFPLYVHGLLTSSFEIFRLPLAKLSEQRLPRPTTLALQI